MAAQIQLSSDASALEPALDAARNDRTHEVLPDVAYRRLGIVDVVFCGPRQAGDRAWVLIDAGLPGTKGLIRDAAAAPFGADAPGGDHHDPRSLRSRGRAGGSGARMGCAGVRAPAGAALPERACLLPARRFVGGRRADAGHGAPVPPRTGRCRGTPASPARGRHAAWHVGLGVVPLAGVTAWVTYPCGGRRTAR